MSKTTPTTSAALTGANITTMTSVDAIKLCKILYVALGGDYFPALTGGLLYKEGPRKDIDIVIYRHRQNAPASFEMESIVSGLLDAGLNDFKFYGFVTKAKWKGFSVDLFNPESASDEEHYDPEANRKAKDEVGAMCLSAMQGLVSE